jgi:predicted RNA-binding Zn-ribbon protein involved in translation (DUF1610 family)
MRLRERCGRPCRAPRVALVRAARTVLEWGRAPGCIGSVVWRARAVAVLRATVSFRCRRCTQLIRMLARAGAHVVHRRPLLFAVPVSLAATLALAGPALADVSFSATPHSDTNQPNATFVFGSGASPYTCSTNGGAFVACASPLYLSGLSEGVHSFAVRDNCSNVCPPPLTYDWTTDYTPPDVALTSKPPATTNQTIASFGFSSTDATATFKCSLNGGAYSPCTSPQVYSGLGDGTREFNVESVDPAGNVSLMTGSASWAVDLTPPVTTIATSVDKAASTVAVTLSSTINGSTFQCSLDGQPYSSCQPRFTLTPPAVGQNTLAVKATSPAGNVETTPAMSTLAVYPAPPAPTVSLLKVPAPTLHPTKHSKAGDTAAAAGQVLNYPPPKILPVITGNLEGRWAVTRTTRLQFSDSAENDVNHYEIATTVSIGPELLDSSSTFYGASSGAVVISLANGTTCYSVVAVSPDGNDSPATKTCTSVPFGTLALSANSTLGTAFGLDDADFNVVADPQDYEGGHVGPGPLNSTRTDAPLIYYTGTLECWDYSFSIHDDGSCDEVSECASLTNHYCAPPGSPYGEPSSVSQSDPISDVGIVATTCPSCGSVQIDLSASAKINDFYNCPSAHLCTTPDTYTYEPARITYKHVLNLTSSKTHHGVLFDLPGLGQHGKPDELLWISRRSGTPKIEGVGWF